MGHGCVDDCLLFWLRCLSRVALEKHTVFQIQQSISFSALQTLPFRIGMGVWMPVFCFGSGVTHGSHWGTSGSINTSRASVTQLVRARDYQPLGRPEGTFRTTLKGPLGVRFSQTPMTQFPMVLNFIESQIRVLNCS